MAKNVLPVNFQDDILNASMNGKRRYRMTQNSDGTVSFEDVTDYDQVGNNFGGAQINQTNTAVNASADASKIIDSLDAVAANTQPGYMAGALAVKELNTGLMKINGIHAKTTTSGITGEITYTVPCDAFVAVEGLAIFSNSSPKSTSISAPSAFDTPIQGTNNSVWVISAFGAGNTITFRATFASDAVNGLLLRGFYIPL